MIPCDGQSALESCFGYSIIVSHRSERHDLILAIRRMSNELPIQIISKHTKGYQDPRLLLKNLDLWAMQNIDVDTNAGLLLHDRNTDQKEC